MNLYALSDLHLPSSKGKTQDKFGENWINHPEKIRENWTQKISRDDIILIPGDISWATKWEEAVCDLEFLASLPGHKYLVEGNHDYWLFSKRNPKKR